MSGGPGLSDDAADRLQSLRETGDLLWRTNTRLSRGRRDDDLKLVVVPSAARPRLAVPAAQRRAAATAVLAHGESDSRAAREQRRILAWLFRCGLGRLVGRTGLAVPRGADENVLTHLEAILGERLSLSLALTPRRANRKPVLHLLDRRGRTVAFAKLGTNDRTRALVRHEGEVLTQLGAADLRVVQPPRVISAGVWAGHELLVLAPLPTRHASAATPQLLGTAMRELSAVPQPDGPRPTATYLDELRARATAMRAELADEDRAMIEEVGEHVDTLAAESAAAAIPLGWWHGDWTPWNCREHDGRLLLWDWERCTTSVPVGFDAAHHYIQTSAVRDRVPRRQAAADCVARAPELLHAWGLDADQAAIVVGLYLAEISLRYLADDQRQIGGPGGDIGTWALPALRALVQDRKVRTDAS